MYKSQKSKTTKTTKSSKQPLKPIPTKPTCFILVKNTGLASLIECGNIARELASAPANMIGGPSGFIDHVKILMKHSKQVKIKVLNDKELLDTKLNMINAMGKGAENEAKLLIIEYTPLQYKASRDATVCIAGKGVCFDSGGYTLKPKGAMYGMNTDKTGAAVAVALIHHAAMHARTNKTRLIGIIPLIENRISANAVLPGDVVTAYNGKTIEIANTDAEGRVIIADALAYAYDVYKPNLVVDLGTFTGWSTRQHCGAAYVYFTLNNEISNFIKTNGNMLYDRGLQLPCWPEYVEYCSSRVADLKNISDKCIGDGNMCAMFLLNFVPKNMWKNWLHIDIICDDETFSSCNSFEILANLIKHLSA